MAEADKRELNMQLSSSHGSFELVVSPMILGALGWWIDGKAGTGPWLLVGFAALGLLGAVVKLYYSYQLRMAEAAEADRAARAEKSSAEVAPSRGRQSRA